MMSGSNGDRMWTLLGGLGGGIERLGPRPVLQLRCSLERDRQQLLAAHPASINAACRLARGVEVAERIEAHDALRAQGPVEQVVQ